MYCGLWLFPSLTEARNLFEYQLIKLAFLSFHILWHTMSVSNTLHARNLTIYFAWTFGSILFFLIHIYIYIDFYIAYRRINLICVFIILLWFRYRDVNELFYVDILLYEELALLWYILCSTKSLLWYFI